MSLRESAKAAKIIHTTVWKIEQGSSCRWGSVQRLASAYSVPRSELERLRALWLSLMSNVSSTPNSVALAEAGAQAAKTTDAKAFARGLVPVLSAIPRSEWKTVASALAQPRVRKLFPALMEAFTS